MPENLSGETRLFPIIGDPIKYVESPERLTASFARRGHQGMCVPMQVPEDALADVMGGLAATGNVDGLLVTMPHKFAAFDHCATTSERTRRLGVVSVVRRNPDGSWHGDMLDGLAFVKAQTDHGAHLEDAKVLLLGAGGAGSAIAIALLEGGVRELVIHDPDQDRADELAGRLSGVGSGSVTVGPADPTGGDLVCNASPLGMNDDDPLPVDADALTDRMFVGDVIAGHGVTPFLQAAQAAGCRTADGVQMVEAVQEIMLDFMINK